MFLGAAACVLALMLSVFVPSFSRFSAPAVDETHQFGTLASFGAASVSWTKKNILSDAGDGLSHRRGIVIPLTCEARGETSMWQVMLAKTLSDLDRAHPGGGTGYSQTLLKAINDRRGERAGTVTALALPDDNVFRHSGISALILVCVSLSQPVSEQQIGLVATEIFRTSAQLAGRSAIDQIAIPKMPFLLEGETHGLGGGPVIFWNIALSQALADLRPNRKLDILFGLFSLGDKGLANAKAFFPAAQNATSQMKRPSSTGLTAIWLVTACFVGACLGGWYAGRRPSPAYLAAMVVLALTGLTAIIGMFSISAIADLLPESIILVSLKLAASFCIGFFGEKVAQFDWKKALRE